jgi:hypothetical protein
MFPPDAGKGVEESDFEKRFPQKPFIKLSSTAALIRHLFALNAVIAANRIRNVAVGTVKKSIEAICWA